MEELNPIQERMITLEEKMDRCNGEINALKIQLKDTDYKCLKFAEGAISEEEYAPIREMRAESRERINELEDELIDIEAELEKLYDLECEKENEEETLSDEDETAEEAENAPDEETVSDEDEAPAEIPAE